MDDPDAAAVLCIFARLREEVGESGPNLTDLRLGESGGEIEAVEGGVSEPGLKVYFCLLVLVEAGSLHTDYAQRLEVLDLRSLAGCMVGWVAGLRARCFDCHGPRS